MFNILNQKQRCAHTGQNYVVGLLFATTFTFNVHRHMAQTKDISDQTAVKFFFLPLCPHRYVFELYTLSQGQEMDAQIACKRPTFQALVFSAYQ